MQSLPSWYGAVIEFSYVYHSFFDLLFIVFGFLIVGVVSRPSWRHHLRWAVPTAMGSFLDGLNRLAMDLHHYLGLGARLNMYLISDFCNWLAVLFSCYGVFMLWRTLRTLAQHPASSDPLALHPPQPGVWPPPPTVPTIGVNSK